MNRAESAHTPKVLVSIVNWNGCRNTLGCLQSLLQLDYPNVRIIVVDNASRDDSVQAITAAYPGIEVLQSDTNLGFAGGHCLTLEKALQDPDVELIWLLNNDIVVQPDTLTELVKAYHQFGTYLYGSIPLKYSDPTLIDALHGFEISEDGSSNYQFDFATLNNTPYQLAFGNKKPRIVTDIHGSCFMIPMSVIRKYGFMDTSYFLYAEELDYCYALRKRGINCILVPQSTVRHIHSASLSKDAKLGLVQSYYTTRNRLIMARRHNPRRAFLRAAAREGKILLKDVLAFLRGKRKAGDDSGIIYADAFYRALGIYHALIGRTGKTVAPEDFWK